MPARQAFLDEAIEVLGRSLDYHETLRTLAWLTVPRFADWCAVDMREDGVVTRVVAAHRDPEKLALLATMGAVTANPRSGVSMVLETGTPILVPELTPEMLAESTLPENRDKAREFGLRSYICVPLRRSGAVVGAITLATAESERVFDHSDLLFATSLADRASIAIEHATLFRELERARAEAAAERDRLRQLVEAAPLGIGVLLADGLRVELANAAFATTYGGRNMVGHTLYELDPINQRVPEVLKVIETGVTSVKRELPISFDWTGTGVAETRYFNATRAPLRDGDGVIDAVLSFSHDVTEQVLARQTLEEARAQAELANRAKDEFLAMLGHELRNPLAPILTALELMALRAPETLQRERTVIERQVRHLVRLVDDLLDISRITRGRVELDREQVDLADVVAKAIEQASPLLEEKQHELVTQVARGVCVHGDSVRLAQIVTNLVTNAAKYTPAKGRIEIVVERDGGMAHVHVRDNGMGIAPEVLPHVFETFYQARQSIDRTRGGLGLGLAIVRSLVTAHGGTVSATSAGLGAGSEFSIALPLSDATVTIPRATGTPVHGTPPLRPERILLVDDNVDASVLLGEILAQRGFHTLHAHDGPSAIAIAEQTKPHIALLDIGLPVMDGYELARRLRLVPGLAKIQLVALTGYGQAADAERARAAGFDAHLVKPIDLVTVLATLERLIAAVHAAAVPTT